MAEFELSGNSRYPLGAEFTKLVLDEISTASDMEPIIAQIEVSKSLGEISEQNAGILRTVCEHPDFFR